MDQSRDVRWKQRFANFEKAYKQLASAIGRDTSDDIMRAGLIQYFEFTFELAWKTLKDKMEYDGHLTTSAVNVFREAVAYGILSKEDGDTWLEALGDRNQLAHVYDDVSSKKAEEAIRSSYFPVITKLYEYFRNELRA